MKFFIVTALRECRFDIYKILKQVKINVFSVTDVVGFKEHQTQNLLNDWLACGDEKFDSMFIFSFTSNENAEQAMDRIKNYNETHRGDLPVYCTGGKSKLLIGE